MVTRRGLLRGAALAVAAPMIQRGRFCLFAQTQTTYSGLTLDLVQRSTVIDMLGLLTLDYSKLCAWEAEQGGFAPRDFEKLRASGITVFHPAVGFTEGDVYASSMRDITGWNRFIASHPSQFLRVDCADDFERAKASGKIGIVIGQQNSRHFRSVEDVDTFYRLGQRVSQLTYDDNEIGGGSTDPRDPGLSEYGVRIIDRMNALGMAVDVSHCDDRTTLDTLNVSAQAGAGHPFQLPRSGSRQRALQDRRRAPLAGFKRRCALESPWSAISCKRPAAPPSKTFWITSIM